MNINFYLMVPEAFLLSAAIFFILFDLVIPHRLKNQVLSSLTLVAIVLTVVLVVLFTPFVPKEAFNGFVKKDLLVSFSQVLILVVAFFTTLVSFDYLKKFPTPYVGEYYYTLLFAVFGLMLMVEANELSTLFVSLEVSSISLYILASLFSGDYRGKEAALKYFILGSVGAATIAYGFALLYGITGSTLYPEVASYLKTHLSDVVLPLLLALVFIVSGFLFKVGAVPFHGWVPDVYHGAPTPVTLFMGAAVKVAAFMALLRLFIPVFPLPQPWNGAFIFFAVVTMFAGALMALNQENLKRMLAYSAISHTGVILAAAAALPSLALFTVFFYLFAYAFMTVAAFGFISALTGKGFVGENLSDLKGLYSRNPFMGLLAVVIFMSLAGIPPLLGFWAKFWVLMALVKSDYLLVALSVLVSSLISLYFYLKPIVYIFMKEGEGGAFPGPSELAAVVVASAVLVVLGLFPSLVSELSLFGLSSFLRGLM
ncbi:NADH-quinone oxidoreductase subunit N [Thermovibrio ammonificans]